MAFKTTLDVFTSVGPDNSLERLTERWRVCGKRVFDCLPPIIRDRSRMR
jgi:hypothetical protein